MGKVDKDLGRVSSLGLGSSNLVGLIGCNTVYRKTPVLSNRRFKDSFTVREKKMKFLEKNTHNQQACYLQSPTGFSSSSLSDQSLWDNQ